MQDRVVRAWCSDMPDRHGNSRFDQLSMNPAIITSQRICSHIQLILQNRGANLTGRIYTR